MTAAPLPRTVTVRVRSLVLAALVVAVSVTLVAGGRWLAGIQPLAVSSTAVVPLGLPRGDAAGGDAAVYRWRRGGRVVVTLHVENTARVPITVTGVVGTPDGWVGALAGPVLRLGDERGSGLGDVHPFHPVSLGRGEQTDLAFVFAAAGAACRAGRPVSAPGSEYEMDAVTLHFELPGGIGGPQRQTLALGSPLGMLSPTAADCRR